jgi:hypothetical protein
MASPPPDRVLVKASPVDRVWGIGLIGEDPRAGDPAQWRGLNPARLRDHGRPGRLANERTVPWVNPRSWWPPSTPSATPTSSDALARRAAGRRNRRTGGQPEASAFVSGNLDLDEIWESPLVDLHLLTDEWDQAWAAGTKDWGRPYGICVSTSSSGTEAVHEQRDLQHPGRPFPGLTVDRSPLRQRVPRPVPMPLRRGGPLHG